MKTVGTKGLWAMALFAASTGFAVAQDTAPATATTAEQEKDPMICRNERVTGSNIPKRVCMTKSQREQARIEAQTEMAARSRQVYSSGQ